ncbi:MAG TPA: alpha/beta fold hydrolase [Niabella sp.]|nr:alpha/beta fold hydrolase [Niabella sp.]HQW14162.1 alpha/beta fold hydrolase [Niabella sp.]HQX19562.1 alpha/beta fold hydrolase [Niabella sp.]HQX40004.1 alpha/beta fold hydrolase [Niabella sp.]HRB06998.1 alpha/beta fold hydrolase [Niabella sp.]
MAGKQKNAELSKKRFPKYMMITNNNFKKLYATFLVLLFSICGNIGLAQSPKVATGRLLEFRNFRSEYIGPRMVRVWLPDNYSSSKRYNVVYANDGQNLWDASNNWTKQEWTMDETMGRLQKQHQIKPGIVVSVDNAEKKRHSEYFPQKPFELLPNKVQDSIMNLKWGESNLFSTKIYSDTYLKFLVEELKPFIDSSFSTYRDRKHTFIIGSSMGGLISLYALCEYPQIFGGAICMSTHWPGIFNSTSNPIPAAFYQYLQNKLPDPTSHKIYFDYGTQTLDADYEPFQLEVDRIMKSKGYTQKNWKSLKVNGAAHVESSWAQRLYIPIIFMLK